MYGWIWRHLPGPIPVRIIEALLLTVAVVAVLFLLVFPAMAPLVPWEGVTAE